MTPAALTGFRASASARTRLFERPVGRKLPAVIIRRRNRRALDRTTALPHTPSHKAALAHILDHSDAAHNFARNAFARCRDPLRVGTHRVVQKLRGTDR